MSMQETRKWKEMGNREPELILVCHLPHLSFHVAGYFYNDLLYIQLNKGHTKLPLYNMKLIIGYFNAQVGKETIWKPLQNIANTTNDKLYGWFPYCFEISEAPIPRTPELEAMLQIFWT